MSNSSCPLPARTAIFASVFASVLSIATTAFGGTQTVGLFQNDPGSFDGYTLFEPLSGSTTYLVDNNGEWVHKWEHTLPPGNSFYLLENGVLLRCADPRNNMVMAAGGDGGLIEMHDWDGTILWSYLYSDPNVRAHHDIAPLPNGNVLILAWEWYSAADAIEAGRDPGLLVDDLWPEHVVEVQPDGLNGGTIVWEWHLWDHLVQDQDARKDNFGVVGDHPELVNINYAGTTNPDWVHANALDYNEDLDQVLINSPRLHEVWVIDHSTSTAEAAGHTGGTAGRGGDILFRWGNPAAYDAGLAADQDWFGQHDVHWIDSGLPGGGNIMAFNNGNGRPAGAFSSIEEIVPPTDGLGGYTLAPGTAFGPAAPTWTYTDDTPTDFYAAFLSGCQRLPNGNTLICSGPWGTFSEVTPAGETVWLYVSPATGNGPLTQGEPVPAVNPASNVNRTFRCVRYAPGYAGLAGKDLTPQGPIEVLPCDADADGNGAVDIDDLIAIILDWGTNGTVNGGDVDGSGVVDVDDLIQVILNFGPCP